MVCHWNSSYNLDPSSLCSKDWGHCLRGSCSINHPCVHVQTHMDSEMPQRNGLRQVKFLCLNLGTAGASQLQWRIRDSQEDLAASSILSVPAPFSHLLSSRKTVLLTAAASKGLPGSSHLQCISDVFKMVPSWRAALLPAVLGPTKSSLSLDHQSHGQQILS